MLLPSGRMCVTDASDHDDDKWTNGPRFKVQTLDVVDPVLARETIKFGADSLVDAPGLQALFMTPNRSEQRE
jgi:hypothetical protein